MIPRWLQSLLKEMREVGKNWRGKLGWAILTILVVFTGHLAWPPPDPVIRITPISLPDTAKKSGLTDSLFARMIRDELIAMQSVVRARTHKLNYSSSAPSSAMLDAVQGLELTVAGQSIKGATLIGLEQWFSKQTFIEVTGDALWDRSAGIRLMLRVSDHRYWCNSSLEHMSDSLIPCAASQVLSAAQPVVFAAYSAYSAPKVSPRTTDSMLIALSQVGDSRIRSAALSARALRSSGAMQERLFLLAIDADWTLPEPHIGLSHYYDSLGLPVKALNATEYVSTGDSVLRSLNFSNRAAFLNSLGRYHEASMEALRSVQAYDSYLGRLNYGTSLLRRHQWAAARLQLEHALTFTNSPAARVRHAVAALNSNDTAASWEDVQDLDKNGEATAARVLSRLLVDSLNPAMLHLVQTDIPFLVFLGTELSHLGDIRNAAIVLDAAHALAPHTDRILAAEVRSQCLQGDGSSARKLFATATNIHADFVEFCPVRSEYRAVLTPLLH